MQALKRHEIVSSVKGTAGGYVISTPLNQVNFLDFLRVFEDDTALVDCLNIEAATCQQASSCTIRQPISAVNAAIHRTLRSLSLAQLFDMQPENSYRVPVDRLASPN